jgi:KDO2-lipid IV(A) lauroyltransferase
MGVMGKTKFKYKNGATTFLSSGMLYYYLLLSLVKMLSHIPFRMLYVLSDMLFPPFYFIIRYRRKIVRKNLTESFPDKGIDEIISIEKKFYHFFIDMALESCKLMAITPEELRRRMKFTNIEMANDLLAEGKSIAAFLGHYGNWEWITSIGLWLHEEAVVAQIYRKLRNKSMDKIMKRLRERMGTICVEMHKTVRFMAGEITDNRPSMIGFIADQSPKRREVKHFVPFLNHQTPVLTGTEKAAKHYGYKAIFISMRRVKRGYYECELSSLHGNPQSLPDFELTDLYFRRLEYEILQHPEFYLWTHNRFKYARSSGKTNK